MKNKETIFIARNFRFIIEQTIGPKIIDVIREKYAVKELRGNGEIVFLVEEKENEQI